MDARAYWNSYVEKCGGLAQTAEKLHTPYSTIACISNGSRGIGRNLARRFKEADPEIDETQLVWVAPVSSTDQPGSMVG